MYMKCTRFVILFALLSVLVSCGSDEPFRNIVFADSPVMFNSIREAGQSSGSSRVVEGVSYYIVFDDELRNATLTINNFKSSPTAEPETAVFSNVEWTYGEGSHEKDRVIEAETLVSDGEPGAVVTLSNVMIVYSQANDLNPEPTAGFSAAYTVDGVYDVLSYPYAVYGFGTTTVSNPDSIALQDVDYDPIYRIDFHPGSMSADLRAEGLTLSGETVDVSIANLSLELTPDGYSLKSRVGSTVAVSSPAVRIADVELEASAEMRGRLDLTISFSLDGTPCRLDAYLSPDMCLLSEQ